MSTAIDFPASLPSVMRLDGMKNRLGNGVIRTQMETGPDKVRRRFTAVFEPLSGSLVLTEEQTEELETFYYDTLKHGSLSFNWTHPRKLVSEEMRFTEPPRFTPADGLYTTRLSLEVMP